MAEEVVDTVLDRVLPGEDERRQNQEMFTDISSFIQEEFGLSAGLMGSTAKDTFMTGDKDLDVFVFFPEKVSEEELEEKGLAVGEAVFDEFGGEFVVEYAEHPYTKGSIAGYEVEIVPAYEVSSGEAIRSSVDRTPFHTAWVNDNLSVEEKRQVVVLKAFLRGQGLYGSTLRIEGFSGYLCELLIAEYGSFEAVLDAAVDWEEEEVIDPAGQHEALPNYLANKFSEEPLVVIDPVDSERNVASVLSAENYARFIYAAWNYVQQPDTTFFFPEPDPVDAAEVESAADQRGDFVVVRFPTAELVDDILYPQLRRLMRRIHTLLDKHEFRTFSSAFYVGEEVRLVFELFSAELPGMRKHRGPKVFHNQRHIEQFTGKYDDVWVEGDQLTTIVPREYTTVEDLFEEFFTGDLQGKGVPKQLVPAVEQREITDLSFDGGEGWRRFLRDELRL